MNLPTRGCQNTAAIKFFKTGIFDWFPVSFQRNLKVKVDND